MTYKKFLSMMIDHIKAKTSVTRNSMLTFSLVAIAMAANAVITVNVMAQNRAFVEIERQRDMPIRGQSQSKVRSQYGEPASSTPAVGQPPISRWSYPGFTVYFEYSHVITTVAEEDVLPTSLGNIQ